MSNFIGRVKETKLLEQAMQSPEAELIAVYGRRRIGKTFLIRSVYEKHIRFEFTGTHNAGMREQLEAFSIAVKKAISSPVDVAVPKTWTAAFHVLENALAPMLQKGKAVIFFDEFPWIHTQKSNFLPAFQQFWNTWASKNPDLTVVICGSAASWMIRNIINSKGGLHNRVTCKIRLLPFTLNEMQQYLAARNIKIDQYQQLQLYMAIGGVPFYLKGIKKGESTVQAIDKLCFTKDGPLRDEFKILYASLFENPDQHMAMIRLLYDKTKGLTRNEMLQAMGITSGGTVTNIINELEESGFIAGYIPFENTSKEKVYRLTDEYSLFYMKFIEGRRAGGAGTWAKLSETASYKSWCGYAFEGICLKHVSQIEKALKLENTYTEASVWRYVPGKGQAGAQIDLLLDRNDHTINICEMKFDTGKYTITKKYADELINKRDVFISKTKTRKTLFITMVTTYGVAKNKYFDAVAENEITMDALFV